MSRCRACNAQLYTKDTPAINPHTGQEEDLCGLCRGESRNPKVYHEYVGGSNPVDGAVDACETPTSEND